MVEVEVGVDVEGSGWMEMEMVGKDGDDGEVGIELSSGVLLSHFDVVQESGIGFFVLCTMAMYLRTLFTSEVTCRMCTLANTQS